MSSTTTQTASAAPSSQEIVFSRMETLQEELEKGVPSYKDSLRTIHSMLRADPDLVHVLSEEQIGVVIAGLSKHKGVVITEIGKKGSGSGGKKSATISLDDI